MSIATAEPIRLRYSEKDAQVLVEPEDQDRFILCVQEAIMACRILAEYKILFEKQLNYLKNLLGEWARDRKNKIHKVFLTLQDARMLFLVVMKEAAYDPVLEEELTALDLKIARDPNCSKISLDVQAMPFCGEEGYISFCNPRWILEYSETNA